MAKKKSEYAAEVLQKDDYLKEVLSLIPEDKKEVILDRLGERVMARDEFSRSMDDLRTKEQANVAYKETLDGWWNEKLSSLEEGDKAKAELAKLKGNTAPASDALKQLEGFIKKEDHEKIVSERIRASEEAGLNVITSLTKLGLSHLHEYGEALDPDAVVAAARKTNKSLHDAYMDLTTEKREAKRAKAEKDREEKLRAEIRAELQKEQGHGVFPTGPTLTPEMGGSALTGLKKQEGTGVAAAVEDFFKNSTSRRAS